MFAVKFIYLYNCCKKPEAHKQPWKISESWCGVMRGEKKVSTGYEKGTDTGNGHIWRRFIVSGASHSNLITASAQSWAWHRHIHFRFGIQQNYCCSFKPRAGEGISLSFWGKCEPNCICKECCCLPMPLIWDMNITFFKSSRQGLLVKRSRRVEKKWDRQGEYYKWNKGKSED